METHNDIARAVAQGQFDAATGLLRSIRFAAPSAPDVVGLWEEIHAGRLQAELDRRNTQALEAEQAADWQTALEIWTDLKVRGFEPRSVALGLARSLSALGMHDLADARLVAALSATPDDTALLVERAKVASARGEPGQHAQRWRDVMRLSPDAALFAGVAALALRDAGDLDGAVSLLDAALRSEPDRQELLIPRAVVAEQAEDWKEAVRCWTKLRDQQPDNTSFQELLGRALWSRSLDADALDDSPATAAIGPHAEDDAPIGQPDLMLAFENLCGNCELGLVQRHFGVDPVGLFRFSEVRPVLMEELLQMEFKQLGDPKHTIIKVERDEYIMLDDRGYFWMHTMVKVDQVHSDKYLKQQNARITMLRKKLIADLRVGSKIFVCKEPAGNISDDSLHRLSALVARYSDAVLLGVRNADPTHPTGTVTRLADRILVGYVSVLFGAGATEIDFPGWKTMLEGAYRRAIPRALPARLA